MNILFVNPNVIMGGAQKILLSLASHLGKFGHRIVIYTTLVDRAELSHDFQQLQIHCSRYRILKKGGVTTRYQNISIVPLAVRLIQMRQELYSLIRQHDIDIILAHQPPAPWLCSFLKVPVVWNCFEPIALWKSTRPEYFSLRPSTSNALLRFLENLYEWCDRLIVRHGIPHIFVLSKRLQRQVESLYGRQAEVFYVGSDPPPQAGKVLEDHGFKALDLDKTFVVLQVGQFNFEKNHQLTLQVVKKIIERQAIERVKLLLVGEGELRGMIEEAVLKLGLQAHTHLLGSYPINDPRLDAIYRLSNVLVFPSIMQSWGLAPFEALAHGVVPIVSTDCGASELIQEQDIGYVAEPTVDGFYEALVAVYRHPDEARAKAQRGRTFVLEQLTYEQYAGNIERRLEEILAQATTSRNRLLRRVV